MVDVAMIWPLRVLPQTPPKSSLYGPQGAFSSLCPPECARWRSCASGWFGGLAHAVMVEYLGNELMEAMMRKSGWSKERRAKQAEAIRRWQPWNKSTGPRTEQGKAKSARNADKGIAALNERIMAVRLDCRAARLAEADYACRLLFEAGR